jgi:SAM-dependent methyltransferase
MKASGLLWVLLGITSGLLFFWLFPLKLLSRLAARFGKSAPCPASLAWLVDNPIRRYYMRAVLDRVGIRPGERVLELGPGPGTLTVEAARRVGPAGQLIAVDIQPRMIAQMQERVRGAGLINVEPCVADACQLPLDDASVDRAFLIAVLPEIPDQAGALAELHRILKPHGSLSITEEFLDPDYVFAFETIRRAEAAGFKLDQRSGSFLLYTLNFREEA